MRVKRFTARTLPEAVAQVRMDLGPDAVILSTRQVKVGSLFGLFGRRVTEVTAGVEHGHASRSESLPAVVAEMTEHRQTDPDPVFDQGIAEETGDFDAMRELVSEALERLTVPAEADRLEPELRQIFLTMMNRGVEQEAALHLVGRLQTRRQKAEAEWPGAAAVAHELVERDLGRVKPVAFGRRVVALVGPTGVGKTTTLAKLAAHFTLHRRMRVGLITIDTFRVAAVDQLRVYSEILDVPLEVVYDQAEAMEALDRLQDRDIVLIDTAGRSPLDDTQMDELRANLAVLRPDEVYLVMSMTSAYREAVTVIDRYLPLRIDRLIFTKWDETKAPGLIYSVVRKYKLPLSYVTTGQNVPEDIERADPARIARAIIGD